MTILNQFLSVLGFGLVLGSGLRTKTDGLTQVRPRPGQDLDQQVVLGRV